MTLIYSHYGEPQMTVSVLSVEHTYLNLKVIFSKAMLNDSALRNPEYYQIRVITPTSAFDFGAISVIPEDIEYPTYVNIEVTDCTNGEDYELIVTPDVIQSYDSDFIIEGGNTALFVGVSELPVILAVTAISSTQFRITFSKVMAQNSDLLDVSKYSFSDNLKVLKVEKESSTSVILTTSEQTRSQIYDLTVG